MASLSRQPRVGEHVGGAVAGVDALEQSADEVAADPPQRARRSVRQHQQGVEEQHRRDGDEADERPQWQWRSDGPVRERSA